jgi:hypothetical protein
VSAHSPGPWRISDHYRSKYDTVVEDAAGGPVGCAYGEAIDPSLVAANARLIAAAPELLEELKGRHLHRDCVYYGCRACALIRRIEDGT